VWIYRGPAYGILGGALENTELGKESVYSLQKASYIFESEIVSLKYQYEALVPFTGF